MRKAMNNKIRKKFVSILIGCMFALMMSFSITTSMSGSEVSLIGLEALISGYTGAYAWCDSTVCSGGCGMQGYESAQCGATGCYCTCIGTDGGQQIAIEYYCPNN
jgi:hypothetical protein